MPSGTEGRPAMYNAIPRWDLDAALELEANSLVNAAAAPLP